MISLSGLSVRLIIGDKCLGMLETISEVFPDAKYQRCTVHFYRNIFSVTPHNKSKTVALMLKAIHAQESKEAARQKALMVVNELRCMKLVCCSKKGRRRHRGNFNIYGFSIAALDKASHK